MIGNLSKQYVYNEDTTEGTHYVFTSREKEVRLDTIFEALKKHHKGLSTQEKKMIRDLYLMFADGRISETTTPSSKLQLMKFTIGYLFGKYSANTGMEISAENVRITGGSNGSTG